MIAGVKRPENGCSTILVEFSEKVLDIAGIGDRTYVPERKPSSHAALDENIKNCLIRRHAIHTMMYSHMQNDPFIVCTGLKHVAVQGAEYKGKSMADARDETETALIVSIDKTLKRTGLEASQVK